MNEARLAYKLASGELKWDKLDEKGKKSITWNPDLMNAIDNGNEDVVPFIAVNRLIEYIKKGKIEYKKLIKNLVISDLKAKYKRYNLNARPQRPPQHTSQ